MARYPLDVNSGVWSGVEDGLKVFDNLEREMLSWGRVGSCASLLGCPPRTWDTYSGIPPSSDERYHRMTMH